MVTFILGTDHSINVGANVATPPDTLLEERNRLRLCVRGELKEGGEEGEVE